VLDRELTGEQELESASGKEDDVKDAWKQCRNTEKSSRLALEFHKSKTPLKLSLAATRRSAVF